MNDITWLLVYRPTYLRYVYCIRLLSTDNPSLQAEIASGVKADKARRATLQSKIDKGMIAPRGNAIGGVMPGEVNGKKTEAKRGLEKKAQ